LTFDRTAEQLVGLFDGHAHIEHNIRIAVGQRRLEFDERAVIGRFLRRRHIKQRPWLRSDITPC
jgi:hypothetical protein